MLTIPGLCWLCRIPLAIPAWGICHFCQQSLSVAPCCPQCGLPALSCSLSCGRCLQKPPPWQRLVFVDDYQPPLSSLVQQLKSSAVTALAPALARLLLLQILRERRERSLPAVNIIICVPLHHRRHWRRGFNQSELIARELARWLSCKYANNALKRRVNTRIQHYLNAVQRRKNLKQAFSLEFSPRGRHIAVVDDVVTTGSTVAEIAHMLMRNGAASVQIWCLCRTL